MASCVIEFAVANIVEARLGGGFRQDEVVVGDISSSEQEDSEHGGNLEVSFVYHFLGHIFSLLYLQAPVDTTSLPSGSICSDAVQPSRMSVSIQAMPEVNQVQVRTHIWRL